MQALSSCSHDCVRGDLDAQHAAGGERGRKQSGRRREVSRVIGIRNVLGSSISDEVTFQAASEPESAAIMVEAASSGTREAKRDLAPVKDEGRSGSEDFQVRTRGELAPNRTLSLRLRSNFTRLSLTRAEPESSNQGPMT